MSTSGRRYDTVSLLTDLGVASDLVGALRAVVRDMAPHAAVVDLSHGIEPYDVRGGSLALARTIGYVPSGVVVAAVDAASDRPHVAIEVADGEGVLIGPDNGLLAPAVAMAGGAERAIRLDDPTRHLPSPGGVLAVRDIYVPVAAHLCNGIDLAELGTVVPVDELLPGVVPLPRDGGDGRVVAEVLWVNHLGDCQLNIGPDDVLAGDPVRGGTRHLEVSVGTPPDGTVRVAEWLTHVGSLGAGSVGAVLDPHGMVALVLSRRSAAEELGLGVGDQVTLRVVDGSQPVSSPVQAPVVRRSAG